MVPVMLATAFMTSCDDFLNTLPDNRTQINTEEKVKELLVNAYPTNYFAEINEMASDNTDDNGASWQAENQLQIQAATWKDITTQDDDAPYQIWQSYYRAIGTANQALEAIEKQGSPQSLNPQKGEALLCRAYAHFILTNLFCQAYNSKTSKTDLGIPYVTTPETTVSPKYDRGTVAEDYANIAKDLEEGLPLINDAAYSKPNYHFNKRAANAFAARFYLYYMQDDKSNLDKVISHASEVLTSNPQALLCDWASIGDLSPNNGIRANAFMDTKNASNLLVLSTYSQWDRIFGPYSGGEKYTHNSKIAKTETANAKGLLGSLHFTIPSYPQIPTKIIMAKFGEYFEFTDPVNGTGYIHMLYPAFTTDELLLDRAEAYALKGEYPKAMEDMNLLTHNFSAGAPTVTSQLINDIYGNGANAYAYYTPTEPTPKKKLEPDFSLPAGSEMYIQAILHLRRVLSLHEGLRWFDIKRYGITIYRRVVENGTGAISVYDTMKKDDPRRAFQLPQEAIKDGGLTPNPRNK